MAVGTVGHAWHSEAFHAVSPFRVIVRVFSVSCDATGQVLVGLVEGLRGRSERLCRGHLRMEVPVGLVDGWVATDRRIRRLDAAEKYGPISAARRGVGSPSFPLPSRWTAIVSLPVDWNVKGK